MLYILYIYVYMIRYIYICICYMYIYMCVLYIYVIYICYIYIYIHMLYICYIYVIYIYVIYMFFVYIYIYVITSLWTTKRQWFALIDIVDEWTQLGIPWWTDIARKNKTHYTQFCIKYSTHTYIYTPMDRCSYHLIPGFIWIHTSIYPNN